MGATNPPVLIVNRLLDDAGSPLANDDTSVTDYDSANEFIVVFQVDEEKGAWNTTYSLRWRNVTDSGSFAVIASSGEMAWGTGTSLNNGDPITSKFCQATGGPSSTWQDGEQVEGAAVSDAINLADECYTEIAFAVDGSSAHAGDQYEFELYDDGNSSSIGTGVAKLTIASGSISVPVGLPSGIGSPLALNIITNAILSMGLPSGVGAPLAITVSGAALVVVGLPSGVGGTLAPTISGNANVIVGIPSGIGEALSTTQLFDYVFSVGIPFGLGEALAVTVDTGGGSELVIVGIPAGAGVAMPTTILTGALISAGLPSGLGEALSVVLSLGANIQVGLPSGAGEALPTTQLFDYVISLGIPSGAGVALPVTVYTDGVPAFTFYISQIVPLEE